MVVVSPGFLPELGIFTCPSPGARSLPGPGQCV